MEAEKGSNQRNWCPQLSGEEPHNKVLPGDMTAHETKPLSSPILLGLQLATAWQEPQAERQEGPSEYQATWILGLSQYNCFNVIAV